jgi:hypothetical protein
METFLPKIVKEFAQKIKERSHYLSKHFVAFIHSLSFFSDVSIKRKTVILTQLKNCSLYRVQKILLKLTSVIANWP